MLQGAQFTDGEGGTRLQSLFHLTLALCLTGSLLGLVLVSITVHGGVLVRQLLHGIAVHPTWTDSIARLVLVVIGAIAITGALRCGFAILGDKVCVCWVGVEFVSLTLPQGDKVRKRLRAGDGVQFVVNCYNILHKRVIVKGKVIHYLSASTLSHRLA